MRVNTTVNQQYIKLLKYLLDNGFEDSKAEIARKLNVTDSMVGQMINGNVAVPKKIKIKLNELYSNYWRLANPVEEIKGTSEAHEEIIKYNAKATTPDYKRVIPVVHYRAQAGFAEGWGDQEWIDDLPTVEVEWPRDGNYLAFEVVGDSMECDCKNNISDRDLVIAREVAKHHWKNKLHIPDTFVIVQRMDGILIKEIIKHDVEKAVIVCHSNNVLFQDFSLSLDDVVKLYHVKEVRRRW